MDVRVRLRPWLESRLNDGWIDGLKWVDREKGIFRIPWKHHSKHTWTEGDAAIFKDWAVVTGRFREGVDTPDWPMWKTRLRCALNKAPDIQEVKQRHNLHCEEPFKVYRFVSKTESLWRLNAIRNASLIFDGIPPVYALTSNIPNTNTSRVNPTFSHSRRPTVAVQKLHRMGHGSRQFASVRRNDGVHMKQIQSNQYGSAYILQGQQPNPYRIHRNSVNMVSNQNLGCVSETVNVDGQFKMHPLSISDCQMINSNTASDDLSLLTYFVPGVVSLDQSLELIPEPEYHHLGIRIQHLNVRVRDTIVTNPNGCCVYYERFDEITSPNAPEPVEVLIPHQVSVANKHYVDLLLDNMVKGIILTVVRGSIYVERVCKCAVFVYIPTVSGQHVLLKKLGRRLREKVFDYDQFLFQLESYHQNQQPRPHFEIVLAFGQQLKPGISTDSLLVWSRVASCRAWFHLHKSDSMTAQSYDEYSNNVHLNNPMPSMYYQTADSLEQSDYKFLNHFNENQNPNEYNGYSKIHTVAKSDRTDPVHEHVPTINFADTTLVTDGIVTEQIIEEGVEVPLDDTDDLTYDTSGSVLQENLIVCDPSQDVSSVPVCAPSSSVPQDVFLSSVDTIDLKSHLLSGVNDTITNNFTSPFKE
uniref:IRF tryptophan pentad repeat domain-containing protein n=1 Tax=Trichobilharzia regenti TaxID=157069 RepID=A0AA85JTX0_TRIRE|nr:unnamed protein product [Trichobilharzia regenti]